VKKSFQQRLINKWTIGTPHSFDQVRPKDEVVKVP